MINENSTEMNAGLNDQISDADLDSVAGGGNWFTDLFRNFFNHGSPSRLIQDGGAYLITNDGGTFRRHR